MKTHKITQIVSSVLLAAVALTAGCRAPTATPAGRGWLDGAPPDGGAPEGGRASGAVAVTAEVEREVVLEAAAAPREAPASGAADSGIAPAPAYDEKAQQQQATLRAGVVDDNEKWDDYLLYRIQMAEMVRAYRLHDRDVSERYTVRVLDAEGYPVLGARVNFRANGEEVFTAYTHATGRALFFPKALGVSEDAQAFDVSIVAAGGARAEAQIVRGETYNLEVTLDTGQPHNFSPALDVLFLIDTTGSMGDEIAAIKENIHTIASEIAQLGAVSDIRFGMTVYRDRGDVYVSRTFDFDTVENFAAALEPIQAGGGGDGPESVNEGLHRAVNAPAWRDGAVHLIIWVGDAPPHLDYEQDYDYAVEMEQAARKGIKIFAIAASGLDDPGEYVWRQVAQYTEGRFVFLTYNSEGTAPGDETTHHVEEYSTENLDALVVRLVTEELAWQTEKR